MYTLCNLPKLVLRLNLRKLDYLHSKIFWNFSFVELTWDDLTQLGRDNARKGIFFARNVDAEYIHILDTDIVGLLEVELYRI